MTSLVAGDYSSSNYHWISWNHGAALRETSDENPVFWKIKSEPNLFVPVSCVPLSPSLHGNLPSVHCQVWSREQVWTQQLYDTELLDGKINFKLWLRENWKFTSGRMRNSCTCCSLFLMTPLSFCFCQERKAQNHKVLYLNICSVLVQNVLLSEYISLFGKSTDWMNSLLTSWPHSPGPSGLWTCRWSPHISSLLQLPPLPIPRQLPPPLSFLQASHYHLPLAWTAHYA